MSIFLVDVFVADAENTIFIISLMVLTAVVPVSFCGAMMVVNPRF